MSAASQFLEGLGARVAAEIGDGVSYKKSKLLLEWPAPNSGCYVQLAGANKWSPFISLAFYFGRRYPEASAIAKRLRAFDPGHIWQYSHNIGQMKGLTPTRSAWWNVDITDPPAALEKHVADAIRQIAVPFWARYPTAQAARDALVSRDPWCIWAVGPIFHGLLYLDAALGDLPHFEDWAARQEPFYRDQAYDHLRRVRESLAHAI